MITRAIIEEVDLSIGKVRVRIPILEDTRNSYADTLWASIIYIPGLNVDYQVGDVVEVAFEDNDLGKPIVLGFLKLRTREIESRIYATTKELKVEERFSAPLDTTIGKTTYQELFDSIDSVAQNTADSSEGGSGS